jgi:hypothetical protein
MEEVIVMEEAVTDPRNEAQHTTGPLGKNQGWLPNLTQSLDWDSQGKEWVMIGYLNDTGGL